MSEFVKSTENGKTVYRFAEFPDMEPIESYPQSLYDALHYPLANFEELFDLAQDRQGQSEIIAHLGEALHEKVTRDVDEAVKFIYENVGEITLHRAVYSQNLVAGGTILDVEFKPVNKEADQKESPHGPTTDRREGQSQKSLWGLCEQPSTRNKGLQIRRTTIFNQKKRG